MLWEYLNHPLPLTNTRAVGILISPPSTHKHTCCGNTYINPLHSQTHMPWEKLHQPPSTHKHTCKIIARTGKYFESSNIYYIKAAIWQLLNFLYPLSRKLIIFSEIKMI